MVLIPHHHLCHQHHRFLCCHKTAPEEQGCHVVFGTSLWARGRLCTEGSRAPAQGGDARAGFALLEHPGVCYPPKTAHVLSTNGFPTGNQSSWRRHWPSCGTQLQGSWMFSAHHQSHPQSPVRLGSLLLPQDGFLTSCRSVPSLVYPQEFTPAPAQLPGRNPCSPPPADPPISLSSYCWEEIQRLLLRRDQCFKTILIPKWNKTKAELCL